MASKNWTTGSRCSSVQHEHYSLNRWLWWPIHFQNAETENVSPQRYALVRPAESSIVPHIARPHKRWQKASIAVWWLSLCHCVTAYYQRPLITLITTPVVPMKTTAPFQKRFWWGVKDLPSFLNQNHHLKRSTAFTYLEMVSMSTGAEGDLLSTFIYPLFKQKLPEAIDIENQITKTSWCV